MAEGTHVRQEDRSFSFSRSQFPDHPGCYLMKGDDGRILYVGKAISLRDRLASYFANSRTRHRKAEMIKRIRDIDVFLVRNEREALVLESNLIRQLDPPYNSRFTHDDDSYYYIALTDETFPRLVPYRKRRTNFALQADDCGVAELFGPYTGWRVRNRILDAARALHPLRTCHRLADEACPRLATQHCLGPCVSLECAHAYRAAAQASARFLRRPPAWRIAQWQREMAHASRSLDYDRACVLRDRIRALEHARQSQVAERVDQRDIEIVFVQSEQVLTLSVRRGIVLALHGPESVPANGLRALLESRYRADLPTRIAVGGELPADLLESTLPIYTPRSMRTPLGQLMEIARINHRFRTRGASAVSTTASSSA